MIRTEDLPLLQLTIHGNKGDISFKEELELSPDEWYRTRKIAFAELRKDEFIPQELLDLVENFKEPTLRQNSLYKTSQNKGLRPRIKLAGKQPKRRPAEIEAIRKRMQGGRDNALTASEALAFFLRILLRDLKYAEKKRKAAPVRKLKMVPRSVIAEVALHLLGSSELWNDPPGSSLIELFSRAAGC